MSMDEQFEQMQYFGRALRAFNDQLGASLRNLERNHDAVSPLWQDEFRQLYDAEWQAFKQSMDSYMLRDAEIYTAFLDSKLQALANYLRGGYGN